MILCDISPGYRDFEEENSIDMRRFSTTYSLSYPFSP